MEREFRTSQCEDVLFAVKVICDALNAHKVKSLDGITAMLCLIEDFKVENDMDLNIQIVPRENMQ